MDESLSRRGFLSLGASACGTAGLLAAGAGFARAEDSETTGNASDPLAQVSVEFPRQDIDSVREIVGASHARFDRVKELVSQRPALAKASWDWGFGDWETPLGAASHVGRRDIAEFLIANGARPNIFTFAMLGEVNAVRGMVESLPGIQRIHGPHGITLMQHAQNRLRQELSAKDEAGVKEVIAYLESLGDADQEATQLALSDADIAKLKGTYRFDSSADGTLVVTTDRRGRLTIARGENSGRQLLRVEPMGFAPVGAPEVRIRFEAADDVVQTVTVHDPMPLVKAVRV